MKTGFVKSSPLFFRMIVRTMLACVALLCALAVIVPAPLQTAADPALTPNPVKSAWFLLWIQELVSWSSFMIWPVLAFIILAFLLPWLPGQVRCHHAAWFAPGQRMVAVLTLLFICALLLLTFVAMFLRGPNWSFSF